MSTRRRRAAVRAPRLRLGFVLPFVIIAVAALSLLSMTLVNEGLQSARGTRVMMTADDAADAAESAITGALNAFAVDSIAQAPLGQPFVRAVSINGHTVNVRWQRHQPLLASVRAIVHSGVAGSWDDVTRDHYRAVWLTPPPIPVPAAVASNGPLVGMNGTLISGSDVPVPTSPCGTSRDTMSVAPVAAAAVLPSIPGGWSGAPMAAPPPAGLLTRALQAESLLQQRLHAIAVGSAPRLLPTTSGVHALSWYGDTVTISGPSEWTGLVTLRGFLRVTGHVRITGLLFVLGGVDASAGELSVQGAVVAADSSATGVTLGSRGRVFFDRCAVQMALATVSRPSLGPFSLWAVLPPDRP